MNVSDLRKMLGLPDLPDEDDSAMDGEGNTNEPDNAVQSTSNVTRESSGSNNSRQIRVRRQSMEQLDLIKVFVCSFIILFFTAGEFGHWLADDTLSIEHNRFEQFHFLAVNTGWQAHQCRPQRTRQQFAKRKQRKCTKSNSSRRQQAERRGLL